MNVEKSRVEREVDEHCRKKVRLVGMVSSKVVESTAVASSSPGIASNMRASTLAISYGEARPCE
jgi:hypothetical protein